MGRKPIPKNDKKMPSDYPQFVFRISKERKDSILKAVESIQETRNLRRKEGEAFVNKNDVIVEALNLGLKIMRKKN